VLAIATHAKRAKLDKSKSVERESEVRRG
jgi:hypothetical protein